MSDFEKILADIESNQAAMTSKQAWNPARQGEIDIRIAADGNWYHEGRRFQRSSLVKLFASVLRREQEDYFLVTPAEKLRIQVEDAPFVATLAMTPSFLPLTSASESCSTAIMVCESRPTRRPGSLGPMCKCMPGSRP